MPKYSLPDWLPDLLRCPISGRNLRRWEREQKSDGLDQVLTHRDGRSVSQLPPQGLLSDDGRWLYPIEGTVVCLVPGEAIDLQGGRRSGRPREAE